MKLPCPSCQQSINGLKSSIGTRTRCPHCQHSFFWSESQFLAHDFVIYDLETTGLDPNRDEFIQIAAVRLTQGELCSEDTFSSYARPRRPISAFIESYTGVSNRTVQTAPRPEEVLINFSTWAADATLIAHNGLRFDSKFLSATCQRHNLPRKEILCIDSIHLSKMLFGKVRGTGHSIDHLVSRLKIDTKGLRRHDARGDVEILGRAVVGMWRQLGLDNSFNGVPRHPSFLPL